MQDFYRQKESGQGSYTSKELIICGKITFLECMAGVYQAYYFARTDWVIPDLLV